MSLEAWGDEGETGPEGYVTDERADEMVAEATADLTARTEELERALAELHDACLIRDSYGVHDSDFVRCSICEYENGPGIHWKADDKWHKEGCKVDAARQLLAERPTKE